MEIENDDPNQSLEKRPGIIFLGTPSVGKRTILSRLVSLDFEDSFDSTKSHELLYGWTIDTKYYSVDVSVCVAHLHDGFSITTIPNYPQLDALIMVFDMNNRSSLVALQQWVSRNDLQRFEVLLCIGNKVDLIADHPVHAEYRKRLSKIVEEDSYSSYDLDYGISEIEGSSLLGGGDDAESLSVMRRSCFEWCVENNIEFVEACGSNADFDKCLSVDGDSQGIERLLGALSAHLWPGMTLKSGDKIKNPSLPEGEDLSEEDSDYEFEYEKLSVGSAEPWDDTEDRWVSASGSIASSSSNPPPTHQDNPKTNGNLKNKDICDRDQAMPSTSTFNLHKHDDNAVPAHPEELNQARKEEEEEERSHFEFDELGQLMAEISNIRDSLRLMPDYQRREMAANMALKMAGMFGGGCSDDEEI